MWALATVAFVVFILVARPQAPAGIPGVVAPGVPAELVKEGFKFLEGPVLPFRHDRSRKAILSGSSAGGMS